jgi:transcription elongation GreA/GreB family factor/energy-coupling factor transporter ATP-binding protein EcfA2
MSTQIKVAIERMQSKLLDLSSRNRLINFDLNRKNVLRFVDAPLSDIYERLVEPNQKKGLLIAGLPDPSRRDWIDQDGKKQRPSELDWARSNGISVSYDNPLTKPGNTKRKLQTLIYASDLANRARSIRNQARLIVEETGSNMLYLVFGFLEYPDKDNEERRFIAPLVNVPVTMNQIVENQQYQYSVEYTGEDVGHNASLAEKLRLDIKFKLPEFDDDSIPLSKYLLELQKQLDKKDGYRVIHGLALSAITSYTDTLLIRDIDPGQWGRGQYNKLIHHPIVKQILQGGSPETTPETDLEYLDHVGNGDHLDNDEHSGPTDEQDVEDIPIVFDADSSQLAAIDAVVNQGKSIVVSGPPGTGKSQTIANMIAALIRNKKRVLFIADKMAALEVVQHRLESVGLGDFLLSLHGTKVNKKEVLQSIERRLVLKQRGTRQFREEVRLQQQFRHRMKSYVLDLHRHDSSSRNNSGYDLIWRYEQSIIGANAAYTQVNVPFDTSIPEAKYRECIAQLERIEHVFSQLPSYSPSSPLSRVLSHVDNPEALAEYKKRSSELITLFSSYEACVSELARPLSVSSDAVTREWLSTSLRALEIVLSLDSKNLGWENVRHVLTHADGMSELTNLRHQLQGELDTYHEHVRVSARVFGVDQRIPVTALADIEQIERMGMSLRTELSTLSGVRHVVDDLGRKLEQYELIRQSIASKYRELGLSMFEDDLANPVAVDVIAILADIPLEVWEHYSSEMTKLDHETALNDILAQYTHVTERKQVCDARYYTDFSPTLDELQRSLELLSQDGLFTRLFSAPWKAARAKMIGVVRSSDNDLATLRQACRDLIDYKLQYQRYQNSTSWKIAGLSYGVTADHLHKMHRLSSWVRRASMVLDATAVGLQTLEMMTLSQIKAMKATAQQIMATMLEHHRVYSAINGVVSLSNTVHSRSLSADNIRSTRELVVSLNGCIDRLVAACESSLSLAAIRESVLAHDQALDVRKRCENNTKYSATFGSLFSGLSTDMVRLNRVCEIAGELHEIDAPQAVQGYVLAQKDVSTLSSLMRLCTQTQAQALELDDAIEVLHRYVAFRDQSFGHLEGTINKPNVYQPRVYVDLIAELHGYEEHLIPWKRYMDAVSNSIDDELLPIVRFMETREIGTTPPVAIFQQCLYRNSLRSLENSSVSTFLKHANIETDQQQYRHYDRSVVSKQAQEIAYRCISQATPPDGISSSRVDEKTDMQLIKYLLPQQRPRVSLRSLLARAGDAIQELKPCFMMSPQAVAQYLTPREVEFDVVIIDEASQVKPEKAIGSIARGKQLVVVGDSKQLPPTMFFESSSQDAAEEELAVDTTSILSLAESHISDHRSLLWHYRSRHESLISFSNKHFYNERLVVTPSPYRHSSNLGVYGVYLAEASYANTMNPAEAEYCTSMAIEWMENNPDKSLGIVALNKKQAELIQRVLDERSVNNAAVAKYLSHWDERGQPMFVKNLENVQGDERDAVIVSITFGPSEKNGTILQNFGPISRTGGERRLNVLFTRAKERLTVVTSMLPEHITVGATTPLGTRILREYLESIQRQNLQDDNESIDADVDEMVVSIQHHLHTMGYNTITNYGTSNSKIDLVVEHPDIRGELLAAIEVDGSNYASIVSDRDRDRLRGEILEHMGWKDRIIRVWSVEWYRNRQKEIDRLASELGRMRDQNASTDQAPSRWTQEGHRSEQQTQVKISADQLHSVIDGTAAVVAAESIVSEDNADVVEVGDTVEYIDVTAPEEIMMFQLVKTEKDNVEAGIISIHRPLGRIMHKHKAGDEVVLVLPVKRETRRYMIMNVHKNRVL